MYLEISIKDIDLAQDRIGRNVETSGIISTIKKKKKLFDNVGKFTGIHILKVGVVL